jgi:hypothetical protein
MADRRVLLPAVDFPEMRLGRHVNHDPQSLRFLVAPPTARTTPKSVKWTRHTPVYNQGNLGTCVPNTGWGILGTDPYWDTCSAELKRALMNADAIQNSHVLPLYRECTANDPFAGQYEPEDTGSDGLTLAKMLHRRGHISGYQHATSLTACHEAIQKGPFAIGVPWYQNLFYPDANGVMTIGGAMVGGHEIMVDEYDLDRDLWWITNSWTASWGRQGRAAMSSSTFQTLLSRQGDATFFVPITAPAPVPTDPPVPDPTPGTDPLANFPYAALDTWANRLTSTWPRYQRVAANEYRTWRNSPR